MSKPDWITLGKSSGNGNDSFSITAKENTGRSARIGYVSVKGNGVETKNVKVSQVAAAIFVRFDNDEFTIEKEGGYVTLTGNSNAPYLNFSLLGVEDMESSEGYHYLQYYKIVDGVETKVGTQGYTMYNGVRASKTYIPSAYTIGTTQYSPTGSASLGSLGMYEHYRFSISFRIPANNGSTYQKIAVQVSTSSSSAQTIIKLASGDNELKIYKDEARTNEWNESTDELTFIASGQAKTLYISSNTTWTIE